MQRNKIFLLKERETVELDDEGQLVRTINKGIGPYAMTNYFSPMNEQFYYIGGGIVFSLNLNDENPHSRVKNLRSIVL